MRCGAQRERGRGEWVREERSEASGATGFSSPFAPSIFGAGSRNVSREYAIVHYCSFFITQKRRIKYS